MILVSDTNLDETARAHPSADGEAIQRSLHDPASFGPIFDGHFDAIYRYLRRRVGAGRAEDLASETFTRAFARRSTYVDTAQGARPWLFGIATRVLRETRRTEARRLRAYARTGSVEPTSDEVDDLVARLDALRDGQNLARLLDDLGHEDREVLLLTAIGELTNLEVAAALGLPPGTVASKLSRLRARLASHLRGSRGTDG